MSLARKRVTFCDCAPIIKEVMIIRKCDGCGKLLEDKDARFTIDEITFHCAKAVLNMRGDTANVAPTEIDPKNIDILRFNIPWCIGTVVTQERAAIEDFTPEGETGLSEVPPALRCRPCSAS